jgi:hypothetical protein
MMRYASVHGGIAPRPEYQLRHAGIEDIPALAALEAAAWPGPLQASQELFHRRLNLGHGIIVAATPEYLAAAVCVIPRAEPQFEAACFPRDFAAFSTLPRTDPVHSVYAYNLCVHPSHRGERVVRDVIGLGISTISEWGARWIIGDGRCPSYAGSGGEGPDRTRPDPVFRAALDQWAATGTRPPLDMLIRDPVLRFYHRVLDCEFVHLARNFLPPDASSGGNRVIFVKDLSV